MLELLSDGECDEALKYCANVFEQAFDIPGRVDIKDTFNKNGALAACMTGSGSAVYGIFADEESALKSAESLKNDFKNVYICCPEKTGVEIISK